MIKNKSPQNFYIHGIYFKSLEEMVEYARKWPDLECDLDQYRKFLDQLYKEAALNKEIGSLFTNKEIYSLLRIHTDWVENDKEQTIY